MVCVAKNLGYGSWGWGGAENWHFSYLTAPAGQAPGVLAQAATAARGNAAGLGLIRPDCMCSGVEWGGRGMRHRGGAKRGVEGSVNEDQLRLGRQRQVWVIPFVDKRVGGR